MRATPARGALPLLGGHDPFRIFLRNSPSLRPTSGHARTHSQPRQQLGLRPNRRNVAGRRLRPKHGDLRSRASDNPNVVTIEPVVVEGDAGVQALLRRQAEGRCADEKAQAVLTCSLAAFTGTKALLTAATGIAWPLAALDAGATVLGGVNCARTVRVYDACVGEQVERAEHAVECEANGGVPVLGSPAYQPVCLGEKP